MKHSDFIIYLLVTAVLIVVHIRGKVSIYSHGAVSITGGGALCKMRFGIRGRCH